MSIYITKGKTFIENSGNIVLQGELKIEVENTHGVSFQNVYL
jgi:hypothetical protein